MPFAFGKALTNHDSICAGCRRLLPGMSATIASKASGYDVRQPVLPAVLPGFEMFRRASDGC